MWASSLGLVFILSSYCSNVSLWIDALGQSALPWSEMVKEDLIYDRDKMGSWKESKCKFVYPPYYRRDFYVYNRFFLRGA